MNGTLGYTKYTHTHTYRYKKAGKKGWLPLTWEYHMEISQLVDCIETIFPPFYCHNFMRQTGITGRRPNLTLTSSFTYVPSIFWLFPLWAGGLLSKFTGPSCLSCRYCALAISDLVGVQHCLLAADPQPPSGGPVASRASLFRVLTKTNRGRDVFVQADNTWAWISCTSAGRSHSQPSRQQRTGLKTLIGVCQRARTLFRLSIEKHSSEGVGSSQSLKDAQRFAGRR